MSDELKMLELLVKADKAISKRFPDMKQVQTEIREYLSLIYIPKEQFYNVSNKLCYAPLADGIKAMHALTNNIKYNLLPVSSDIYVTQADINDLSSILRRRNSNAYKSTDALIVELLAAHTNAYREHLPVELKTDLYEINLILETKNISKILITAKQKLFDISKNRKNGKYVIEDIDVLRINTMKFFIRMLEEKVLGYIVTETK